MATVENIVTVIASIIFNNMYPATRGFLHGFCFLVAVGLLIIPVILIRYKKYFLLILFNGFVITRYHAKVNISSPSVDKATPM